MCTRSIGGVLLPLLDSMCVKMCTLRVFMSAYIRAFFQTEPSVCTPNQQRQDPAGLLCIYRSELCVFVRLCTYVHHCLLHNHDSVAPAGLHTPPNTPQLPQCISISKLNIPGDSALTVRSLLPGSDTPSC